MKLRHTLLLLIFIFFIGNTNALTQSDENPWGKMPYAGRIKRSNPPKYSITLDIGLEQWEKEKKSEFRYQQWYLSCSSPPPFPTGDEPFNTWCSLTRTVFSLWNRSNSMMPNTVGVLKHYTGDGTLMIRRVDWEKGVLDLAVVYTGALDPEGSKIEVSIRLKEFEDSFFLKSFKAFDVAHGLFSDSEVSVLEYRIPEYSYTLNVPFEIKGHKTQDQREYDNLLSSLAPADREVWNKNGEKVFATLSMPEEAILKRILPHYSKDKELTPEDLSTIGDYLTNDISQRVKTLGLSKASEDKIITFIGKNIQETFQVQGQHKPDQKAKEEGRKRIREEMQDLKPKGERFRADPECNDGPNIRLSTLPGEQDLKRLLSKAKGSPFKFVGFLSVNWSDYKSFVGDCGFQILLSFIREKYPDLAHEFPGALIVEEGRD